MAMNRKIEENASSISLYDLWMMVRRNIYSIIYFTVLGLVLGLVYTNMIVTPEYTATAYVTPQRPSAAAVPSQTLTTITTDIKSNAVLQAAVTLLDDDDVTHANGNPITLAEIAAGLTTSSTTTSYRITISYVSMEQDIAVPIVNAVIEASNDVFTNEPYSTGLLSGYSFILAEATSASYTGPSKTLYLAIFVILGGVVGTGLGIFTDIVEDRIHYTGEINALGVNAFDVSFKDKKKKRPQRKDPSTLTLQDLDVVDPSEINDPYYRDVLKLQNDIENFTPDKQVKTIGITSPKEYVSKASLIASLAQVYAKEHQRVLVLDFDFEHPFMHEVFNVSNTKNIVGYYLSYKGLEEFSERINHYLYVMPAIHSAIGSKIIKSDRVKKLIEEAREDFDYILINCPPTLNDMTILACTTLLDGVLIAGKFQTTRKKDFVKTAIVVNNADMHLIGGAFLSAKSDRKGLLNLFSK
jgi:Mrp family chromosome partitioning ATPase/capsular polysaccharide biosynthesis protein